MSTNKSILSQCIAAIHNDEEGMEAVQVVAIVAIAAIVLIFVKGTLWPTFSDWAQKQSQELTQ